MLYIQYQHKYFCNTNNTQQTQQMTHWPDVSQVVTINQPNRLVKQQLHFQHLWPAVNEFVNVCVLY